MTRIPVAEQFYSIQGEGRYAGTPAVFLRLAGCNLQCGLDLDDSLDSFEPGQQPTADGASWICDSIKVWRRPDTTYTVDGLINEWDARGFTDAVADGAHIILTGGEPTLPAHQASMSVFIARLADHIGHQPYVEVETNGTRRLTGGFVDVIDWFNVSLKLANSGMPVDRRIHDDAIDGFVTLGPDRAMFKFVVADPGDLDEIDDLIVDHGIPDAQVALMPAGSTRAQLHDTYPIVAELCKDRRWAFSPRTHVDIWDQSTGV